MPAHAITAAQMRTWEEQTWASGQTAAAVIEQVGRAVARLALTLTHSGDTILLLVGNGNNGKDALAAIPHLHQRHLVSLKVTDPGRDLARLLEELKSTPALVIDGLFGIGLNRPLSKAWIDFLAAVNLASSPVLSVDIPSGLDADSGEPQGEAIRARVTLTVGAPKTGMLKAAAAPYVGRLEVAANVGLSSSAPQSQIHWITPSDYRDFPPFRPVTAHKGSYGHLGIIAGSFGYHGAAVLAARGAQRAQPGLITLETTRRVYTAVASQLQAVMVRTFNPERDGTPSSTAHLLGPGLAGKDVADVLRQHVRRLWETSTAPVVVDASALPWLPRTAPPPGTVRVLTPHPGEAARLLGTTSMQVQSDRFGALRALSALYAGAWIVLKGHQTLIGRDTGSIQVNSSGNPWLGQGGSGDVLAGFVAGYLAQSELAADPGKTLACAVWRHGHAADLLQRSGAAWTVEDLIATLTQAHDTD
jgi:ADP-dependent NAD(P)H-hydrate dehydratase / NAD(P)H-hydrate epimerase